MHRSLSTTESLRCKREGSEFRGEVYLGNSRFNPSESFQRTTRAFIELVCGVRILVIGTKREREKKEEIKGD